MAGAGLQAGGEAGRAWEEMRSVGGLQAWVVPWREQGHDLTPFTLNRVTLAAALSAGCGAAPGEATTAIRDTGWGVAMQVETSGQILAGRWSQQNLLRGQTWV